MPNICLWLLLKKEIIGLNESYITKPKCKTIEISGRNDIRFLQTTVIRMNIHIGDKVQKVTTHIKGMVPFFRKEYKYLNYYQLLLPCHTKK